MKKYPLAKDPVFYTIQGEGALLGTPMVFIRLAGCSVGCPQCDTDYGVFTRLQAPEIRAWAIDVRKSARWVWVTGGEPADYNLLELLEELKPEFKIAVATSGSKSLRGAEQLVDFLSVSPHSTPDKLVAKTNFAGTASINLVPGLNGLQLRDWIDFDPGSQFTYRWVTPLHGDTPEEALKFINAKPGWRLGTQAHKTWGLA